MANQMSFEEIMELLRGTIFGHIIKAMRSGSCVQAKIMCEIGEENLEEKLNAYENACLVTWAIRRKTSRRYRCICPSIFRIQNGWSSG